MTVWHEQDDFWEVMAPKIFRHEHWQSAPAEVDHIIALVGIAPGARILDLCCGPGRHSLELARRGFMVTGVDRTSRYLEEARGRARDEGLSVEFVQADARDFCSPDAFDAVLNLYTSFGYFDNLEDDKKVLANAYSSLTRHGKLLMEVMGKEIVARIFQERDWHEENGVLFLEERQLHADWGGMRNRWIMVDGNRRIEFTFSIRLYSGTELYSLLHECGFRSVGLFGDLDGDPYDHMADRLVVLAEK